MKTLGLVSLVQLVLGLIGLRRGLDGGLVPDVPGMKPGKKKDIARRQWVDGTALSAPGVMLVAQGLAGVIVLFGWKPRRLAARVLGVLGAIMVLGYPLERTWRESMVKGDRELLPFTLGGFVLALKMAILGFAVGRRR